MILSEFEALGYNISEQLWLFVYSLVIGIALAVFFDFLRFTRFIGSEKLVKNRLFKYIFNFFVFLEDILFFIVSSITIIIFCFHTNRGDSRGFILLGVLIGFIFYLFTIGKLTSLVFKKISVLVNYIFELLFIRILLRIIKTIINLILHIYRKTVGIMISKVLILYFEKYTSRQQRLLVHNMNQVFDSGNKTIMKGKNDETGSTYNTGKDCNNRRIPVYDNNPC